MKQLHQYLLGFVEVRSTGFLLTHAEGEDEASLKRHKEFIQNEWSRRHPDMNRISRRMQLTFPDRRRLMNNKADIKDVRAEYPALFDYQQVMIKNLSINK